VSDAVIIKWLAEELMGWVEIEYIGSDHLRHRGWLTRTESARIWDQRVWNPLMNRDDWHDCVWMLGYLELGPHYARWKVQYAKLAHAAEKQLQVGVYSFGQLFKLMTMSPRESVEALWLHKDAVEQRLNNLPDTCRLYRQVDVSAMPMGRGREPQQERTTTEGLIMPRVSKVVQRAEACVAFLKSNPSSDPVKADYFEGMVKEQGDALGLKEGKSEAQIDRALRYARTTLGLLERCRGGGYKLGDDSPNDGGAAQAEQAEAAEKAAESSETPVESDAVEAFDPNAADPTLIPDR